MRWGIGHSHNGKGNRHNPCCLANTDVITKMLFHWNISRSRSNLLDCTLHYAEVQRYHVGVGTRRVLRQERIGWATLSQDCLFATKLTCF